MTAREIFLYFCLVGLGVAGGLGLGEVVLRVARISYPNYAIPDEHLGSILSPGVTGWFRKEGESFVRINSQGLRDREHSLSKPPGTFRVAVLGDSFTDAFQVPVEQTFWSIMEDRLADCAGLEADQVEVISFGKSGRGTAEELLSFRHEAAKYRPDLVLLAFFPGNDIRNNSIVHEPERTRPFFVFQDEEIVLDTSFRSDRDFDRKLQRMKTWQWRTWNWLRNNSRMVQLLDRSQDRILRKMQRRGNQPDGSEDQGLGEDSRIVEGGADLRGLAKQGLYGAPTHTEWEEAWRVTEGVLELLGEEVEASGAQLLVAVLSTPIQVNPDHQARQTFLEAIGERDLDYASNRVEEFMQMVGIKSVDLVAPLREHAGRTGECVHGFANNVPCGGHWNVAGHRVAGTVIAERICGGL